MLHLIRKGIDTACPVCSAPPFTACIQAVGGVDPEPWQGEMQFGDPKGEIEWAEFQVLSAIRTLRDLAPGHDIVKALMELIEDRAQQPQDHPPQD